MKKRPRGVFSFYAGRVKRLRALRAGSKAAAMFRNHAKSHTPRVILLNEEWLISKSCQDAKAKFVSGDEQIFVGEPDLSLCAFW
jgi:hypothetical protein